MSRRTRYLPAPQGPLAAVVLVACAVALLLAASGQEAEATFPGKNGRIAFVRDRHGKKPCRLLFSCNEIYAMNANGQALEHLTNNRVADFNPDWQPLSPPDDWSFKAKGSA